MVFRLFLATALAAAAGGAAPAADWPQWLGPNRDGKSADTGLLDKLPEGGPPLVWQVESLEDVGTGYGSPAVVGNRVYVFGGESEKQAPAQVVHCLDAATGKVIWKQKLDTTPGGYSAGWGGGPRGTPTVDGDKLYVLGPTGDLACLATADGKVAWTKNLVKDFGGSIPNWGYSESPLVDGDKVVVTPGAGGGGGMGRKKGKGPAPAPAEKAPEPKAAAPGKGGVVALNKLTGETIWACGELQDGAGYSSLIPVVVGGVRQYVTQTMQKGVGVRAADGKLLWKAGEINRATAVIPTPVVTPDGHVFFTSGYGAGSELFKLSADGDGTKAEKVYSKNMEVSNHHGGVIEHQGKIFGHSDRAGWFCLDLKAGGDPVWKSKKLDKGSIAYADGHFYCYGEGEGTLVQIKASAEDWQEVGRFTIPKLSPTRPRQGHVWAHPVVANGKLYLRDYEHLYCYDIAQKKAE